MEHHGRVDRNAPPDKQEENYGHLRISNAGCFDNLGILEGSYYYVGFSERNYGCHLTPPINNSH